MALQEVAETSRRLDAHDALATSSREMAIVARQLPDPVLRMSLDNVPVEGSMQWSLQRDFMTMQTIGLMQTFVSNDKRDALSDQYEQEARLSEASRVVELAGLQRTTALAWLNRYYQERILALLQSHKEEADILIETSEALYRAGNAPQMDVFGSRTEAGSLEDRIKETELELTNAIATLERLIGEDARLPLASLPSLSEINVQSALGLPQAEATWLAQQEELALAKTRVARTNRRNDWNVELMYGRRGPDFDDMVTLGVSVPLQWGRKNKQDRELASSLAELENVRHLRAEQLKDYELQIQTAIISWQANLDRLSHYDENLLPLTRERTQAAMASYRSGNAELTDVLDARRAALDLQLEHTQLEKETAELWAQLRFLMPVADGQATQAQPSLVSNEVTGGQQP
jgi:outer membrane protein TolC